MSDIDKTFFQNVITRQANNADYHMSFLFLSRFLERYHQEKVIVLIDEYDSPIHASYLNNYYKEIIEFMRGFLCTVLKDNTSLKRGLVTGILSTAQEGIFSGLNNLKVLSILQQDFSSSFGFTQSEVDLRASPITSSYGTTDT